MVICKGGFTIIFFAECMNMTLTIQWLLVLVKSLIFLLLLFFNCTVQAQVSKWAASYTPAIVYTTQPHYGFQAGLEYRFNERLRILTEAAVILHDRHDSSAVSPRFIRVKPEIRYLIANHTKKVEPYTGLQLSYSFRNWKDLDGGIFFEESLQDDSAIAFRSATVSSPVFTVSSQLGAVIRVAGHFEVDVFSGIGLRVIHTHYSDIQSGLKVYAQPPKCKILISPDPAWWVRGMINRLHLNIGLRILYSF